MQEDRRPLVDPGADLRRATSASPPTARSLVPLDDRRGRPARRARPRLRRDGASRSASCTRTAIPAHERAVAAALGAAGLVVSASSRVLPRVPRVRALEHDGRERLRDAAHGRLSRRARSAPRRRRLSIMQSNGGSISAARPRGRRPCARCSPGPPPASSARAPWPTRPGFPRVISLRHGRHVDRRQPDRRRDRDDHRVEGRRLSRCACR